MGIQKLESLPPEVRRHLLSMLDLPLRKALDRASPAFHRQYLYDRRYLLRQSIKNTLGSVAISACVLDQASVMKRDGAGFLNWYSEQTSGQWMPQLAEDRALDITAYYFRYVKPVSEHYSRVIPDGLTDEEGNEPPLEQRGARTGAEIMRFTRATYNFEIFCQLIQPCEVETIRGGYRIGAFFSEMLEPWEVEELLSIYRWVSDVYQGVFDYIRWSPDESGRPYNSTILGRPPVFTLYTASNIAADIRDSYVEGATFLGLPLLPTALLDIKDHGNVVAAMQGRFIDPGFSVNNLFGGFHQYLRCLELLLERDPMQETRASTPFRGFPMGRPWGGR